MVVVVVVGAAVVVVVLGSGGMVFGAKGSIAGLGIGVRAPRQDIAAQVTVSDRPPRKENVIRLVSVAAAGELRERTGCVAKKRPG